MVVSLTQKCALPAPAPAPPSHISDAAATCLCPRSTPARWELAKRVFSGEGVTSTDSDSDDENEGSSQGAAAGYVPDDNTCGGMELPLPQSLVDALGPDRVQVTGVVTGACGDHAGTKAAGDHAAGCLCISLHGLGPLLYLKGRATTT